MPRGETVTVGACGTHFKHVIHAIAVDVFYQADVDSTAEVLAKALRQAESLRARKVAVVALATGYGPLSMREFGQAMSSVATSSLNLIEQAVVVVRNPDHAQEILSACPDAEPVAAS